MAFSDQSSGVFANELLLTHQMMDQMADNDAFLEAPVDSVPAFGAYLGSNQSIAAGAGDVLEMNTLEHDKTGAYNTTTYRFTPLVAGKYLFYGRANIQAPAYQDLCSLNLNKNGTIVRRGERIELTWAGDTLAPIIAVYEEANGTTDYFELVLEHDNAGALTCNAGQDECYWGAALMMAW